MGTGARIFDYTYIQAIFSYRNLEFCLQSDLRLEARDCTPTPGRHQNERRRRAFPDTRISREAGASWFRTPLIWSLISLTNGIIGDVGGKCLPPRTSFVLGTRAILL